MDGITGASGELCERLLDLVDEPGPRLRAVATTLLIMSLDLPREERGDLMEAMVASDDAGSIIDAEAAAATGRSLRDRLTAQLQELAVAHGEASVVRAIRDHLVAQVQRWASRAVDDDGNRRRAERFLAWADRPEQLEAAQRRGLFAGMDAAELRRLARTQVGAPVTPEAALRVWVQVERWLAVAETLLGDRILDRWADAAAGR